jgi:hypothetical protein
MNKELNGMSLMNGFITTKFDQKNNKQTFLKIMDGRTFFIKKIIIGQIINILII